MGLDYEHPFGLPKKKKQVIFLDGLEFRVGLNSWNSVISEDRDLDSVT